jgi:L-glyceraldehyde 3-phosphate reductase
MSYVAASDRYRRTPIRRSGRSGLQLPAISLGLWQNFGADRAFESQRELLLHAFDRGVFHFDLANNYGPPPGAAEEHFGRVVNRELRAHRHEIVVSTKAGWDMWPGPYGVGGSRKYLLSSLDDSLARMGLDSVDIFYHHRPDPHTPLEETAMALDTAVRSGRAHYVGISSYSAQQSRRMAELLRELGTPLAIHQPSYSFVNRWVEHEGLREVADDEGFGIIAFSALAQGLLTGKYLRDIPESSRGSGEASTLDLTSQSEKLRQTLTGLQSIAHQREQSLTQLALAWALRDSRVTSLVLGARNPQQLDENLQALEALEFSTEQLEAIDELSFDADVDNWADARRGGPLPPIDTAHA